MKKIFIVLSTLLLAVNAWALDLDEAKSKGLVGEKLNGYLGAVSPNPAPDVQALVTDINNKRKAQYQEIAQKNGTQLDAVEKLAAEKAIEKTKPGFFVEKSGGAWVKKS